MSTLCNYALSLSPMRISITAEPALRGELDAASTPEAMTDTDGEDSSFDDESDMAEDSAIGRDSPCG